MNIGRVTVYDEVLENHVEIMVRIPEFPGYTGDPEDPDAFDTYVRSPEGRQALIDSTHKLDALSEFQITDTEIVK